MFSSVSLQQSIHHPASCCLFRSVLLSKVNPLFLPTREENVLPSSKVLWLAHCLKHCTRFIAGFITYQYTQLTHLAVSRQPSPQTSGNKVYADSWLYLDPVMYSIVATRPFLFVLGKLEPQCASLVFRLIVIKSSTLNIFSHSSFSSFFFSFSSLLKKQVLAWIREKLHHLEEKKRNGKEGGNMKKKSGNQTQIHLHI